MILISHRGNTEGINKDKENTESYINNALYLGFNVEIDVWYINNKFWLGHNKPISEISKNFLSNKNFWIHCKNIEALIFLKNEYNCFFHTKEDYVLTSTGYIWTYTGVKLYDNVIAVLPENYNYKYNALKQCVGICSDNILFYKNF